MLLVILFHGSRSCTGHLRAAAAEATWGRAHCLQLSVDLAVSAYLTERGVAAGGDDTFLNVVALDHTVAKNHGGVADEAIAHAEQAIVVVGATRDGLALAANLAALEEVHIHAAATVGQAAADSIDPLGLGTDHLHTLGHGGLHLALHIGELLGHVLE